MLDNTNLFHLLTLSYSKSVLAVEVGGTAVHSHNFAPSYLLKRTNLGRNLLHAVKYEKHYSKPQRGGFGSCKNNLLVLRRL